MTGLGARASCGRCGRTIELRAVSKRPTAAWRWYSSTKADSWHCGSDPLHPTLAHDPNAAPLRKPIEQVEAETAETTQVAATIAAFPRVLEAAAYHDYESPRGESTPTEPCAICGKPYGAVIHE